MSRWVTSISVVGAVLLAFALGRAAFAVASGGAAPASVVDFVLLSFPGLVLWYVSQWLPNTDFDPALYPRVLTWSLGGVGAMFGIILLHAAHPAVAVDFTLGTQAIAVGIGSLGGLAIGIREAEAITRANELENRNDELARHERELERQNERLEEFTSIVSHDLRSPLNVAEGRLALAREGGGEADLAEVAAAHDRMEALIDDLLSLARQGETVDDFDPVDVGQLAEACWEGVGAADATLDAGADCVVLADEQRLRQVLQNLLRNSVEHGGDDVTVTVGPLADEAGFYVADDGAGIPEDERDSVLEHGYSSASDGTGFGLAIVDRISEAHGWSLSITASEAGGARFEFTDVAFADSGGQSDAAPDAAVRPR